MDEYFIVYRTGQGKWKLYTAEITDIPSKNKTEGLVLFKDYKLIMAMVEELKIIHPENDYKIARILF